MLHQPTIEKLMQMRLQGMVDGLEAIEQDEAARDLGFEEKLALIVDRQHTWRQNLAFQQRLRRAKLRGNACVEDIDYRAQRGIDKAMIRGLAQESAWVQRHENLFLVGPTGCGKSFLATALAHKACRDGYLVYYSRATMLFRDLAMARADGSLRNLLTRLSRTDVLVVGDGAAE
jgi:DNA replication protein DnaC